MKHIKNTVATRVATAAIAATLTFSLVPVPALAEAASGSAVAQASPAVVDEAQPIQSQDGQETAIQPLDESGDAAIVLDDAPSSSDKDVEQAQPEADEPMLLTAQTCNASTNTKANANIWTANDTKLVSELLSQGNNLSDLSKIFLSGGNAKSILGGARGLVNAALKWTGKGGSSGPSICDLMNKIEAMNGKLGSIESRIDNVALGVNLINTRDLLESLMDLSTYCSEVEEMFDEAHLAKLGLAPLPEDATPEQTDAWREQTVQAMLKASKDRKPAGFIQFENDMDHIKRLYSHISNVAAESSVTNPVAAWDSYWANYYNWETEGWGARQALRTSTTTTITRAYGLLAVYLQIYKDPDHTETALTAQLDSALAQIGSMDAGKNPEDVRNAMLLGSGGHVWSPTLKKFATKLTVATSAEINSKNHDVPDSDIDAYVRRLHGMNVEQDLQLAGLVADWSNWNGTITVGMAYQGNKKSGTYTARILYWDGHYDNEQTQWTDVHKNVRSGHNFVWLNLTEE